MFDMGFTEMMLIGIVALVVIGPEKLPGVARTAGKYFARLRNFMTNVRADVESELKADELREMFEAQQKELQSLKEVVSDAGKDIGLSDISSEITDIASSIEDTGPEPAASPPAEETKVPKTKKVSKAKKAPKTTVNSNSKAKPKAGSKLKPKAKPKTSSKVKAEPNGSSSIKPPAEDKPAARVTKTRAKSAQKVKAKAK